MNKPVQSAKITVGDAGFARDIEVRFQPGEDAAKAALVWLGGYMSDMEGSKALACEAWARGGGGASLRFDYSGHGVSGGEFLDGTMSRWLEESLAVIDHFAPEGPLILAGSSMGGWLALLCARELAGRGQGGRLQGLILIAPAVDMTEDLLWPTFSEQERREITENGVVYRPSDYGAPYPFTGGLFEDAKQHLLFTSPLALPCPVHILQGMCDPAVPWQHAQKLVSHLVQVDVCVTYVKDGDHSLSRDQDLQRLARTLDLILGQNAAELALS